MKFKICKGLLVVFMVFLMLTSVSFAEEESAKIAFVDTGVEEFELIQRNLDASYSVYLLDDNCDGIDVIARTIENTGAVEEMMIFTKGTRGAIKLGQEILNLKTLEKRSMEISQWKASLQDGADIFIYACNTAANSEGRAFVDQLAYLTNADVAASTNYTGALSQDADWKLEYTTGPIESYGICNITGYDYRLDGTTRTWDGEGNDALWNNPLNWSGDIVPDAFDIAVFDSTSNKDVFSSSNCSVYDLVVTEEYDGEIRVNGELNIGHNASIDSGSFNISTLNISGDLLLTQADGLKVTIMTVDGDVDISGLGDDIDGVLHMGSNASGSSRIGGNFKVRSLFLDESGYDYIVDGNIEISDTYEMYGSPEFKNYGNLTMADGGRLDISDVGNYLVERDLVYNYSYDNQGAISEEGAGRLCFDVTDFYLADSEFLPIAHAEIGEDIYFSLTDLNANRDTEGLDTVQVTVASETNPEDLFAISLTETDINSGYFKSNSGLTLVSGPAQEGELSYDGSENLLARYVDAYCPGDVKTAKLYRDPLVWSSNGDNENWNTNSNWSTGQKPKFYDAILFDETSIEDMKMSQNVWVSSWVIDDGYAGKVLIDDNFQNTSFKTRLFDDLTIRAGDINILSNLDIYGDLSMSGGSLTIGPYETKTNIYGSASISDGDFYFGGDEMTLEGELNQTGGTFYANDAPEKGYSVSEVFFKGDATFADCAVGINEATSKTSGNAFTFSNLAGESFDLLTIEEDALIVGNLEIGKLAVEDGATLEVTSTLTCNEEYLNSGIIDVADSATLDLSSVTAFSNAKIDANATGQVLYPAGGISFITAAGQIVGDAQVGDVVYLELADKSRNLDFELAETVEASMTSQVTGDTETLLLTETGLDTGIFRSSTGIELVSGAGTQENGELQFDGSELIVGSYQDTRDPSDQAACQLPLLPITWDGGGEDQLFSTPLNWSTDRVPTLYDAVVFDGGSSKDADFNTNIEVYSLTVEADYEGVITGEASAEMHVGSDLTIKGGQMMVQGRLQVAGDVVVESGSLNVNYYNNSEHNEIGGSIIQSGGTARWEYGYFDIGGDLIITDGVFNACSPDWWEDSYFVVTANIDIRVDLDFYSLISRGESLKFSDLNENSCLNLKIEKTGSVSLEGTVNPENFNVDYGTELLISGENTELILGVGTFGNSGQIEIANGALLDVSNYNTEYSNSYNNYGQIIEKTGGSFKSDVKDIYFTDASEARVISASVGDALYVVLVDANHNMDGTITESVDISVESPVSGDLVDLTLEESSASSGIFRSVSPLTLVGTLSEESGELLYDGSEDLQVDYRDENDTEDHYIGYLHRAPIYWDGEGADENWNTAENWTEDRVPDAYDTVVFDGRSDKDVRNLPFSEVHNFEVESAYTGTIRTYSDMTISNDMVISGGTVIIESNGSFEIEGDFILSGGSVSGFKWWEGDFHGDVIISGGMMTAQGINISGDFLMTGGQLDNGYHGLDVNGDISLSAAESFLCTSITISGEHLDVDSEDFSLQTLNINGDVDMTGILHLKSQGQLNIRTGKLLLLKGKIVLDEDSNNGLTNSGTLSMSDGSVLNLRKASIFTNTGTIDVSENAKLYFDAEAMGVTDESGAPALDDFAFGQDMIVSLIDPNRNLDSLIAETAVVTLKNWTNEDEESYNLTETDLNTGSFRGSGFATAVSTSGVSGNDSFEGQDSDAFQIIYTDPMCGIVEYVVSSNCAELDIEGMDELLVDGIDYGNGELSGSGEAITLGLQNTGDIPLEIVAITLDNTEDFSLAEDNDHSDILPDTKRDIDVLFTPTGIGEKTANITIKTGDNDEGELVIGLRGLGVEAPTCSGIDDIVVLEGQESYVIELFDYLQDGQDADDAMVYELIQNSNESLIPNYQINSSTGILTLELGDNYTGTSYMKLRVTDTSSASVEEEFSVKVSEKSTVTGNVLKPDGTALEGALVSIIDYYDDEIVYTSLSRGDGSFALEYPRDMMYSWNYITVTKDSYITNERTSYTNYDVNIGNVTLQVESDQEKADRLARALTEEALGIGEGETAGTVKTDLTLSASAGEGSSIEWSSSNTSGISNTGSVTRNEYGEGDLYITLTAKVVVNDAYAEKSFNLWLLQMPAPYAVNSPSISLKTSGDGQVAIEWLEVENSSGYKVFYSETPGDYSEVYATLESSQLEYAVTGLSNGSQYYFVVQALHSEGDSVYSNEVTATPMLLVDAPTDIRALAGNESISVSFTGPDQDIDIYTVTAMPGNIIATGSESPIVISGLENGKAYTLTVMASTGQVNSTTCELSGAVTPFMPVKNTSSSNSYRIYYNGAKKSAATATTSYESGRLVTRVDIDDNKISRSLEEGDGKDTITIPASRRARLVSAELNAQTVEDMAKESAVLEIDTEDVLYKIPALAIDIENIQELYGSQTKLENIEVSIRISKIQESELETNRIFAKSAEGEMILEPVSFEILCKHNGEMHEIDRFKACVERRLLLPEGQKLDQITTAVVVGQDGRLTHVPTEVIEDGGKYFAKINSLTNSQYMLINHPLEFYDAEGHWAKSAINDMGSRFVVSGDGSGLFKPDDSMTRAEFATIMVNGLGLMHLQEKDNQFDDVSSSDWYHDAVAIASRYGIVYGNGQGQFMPMDTITREAAMSIISRAMILTGLRDDGALSEEDLMERFEDYENSSEWAREGICQCIAGEIVSGTGNNSLEPMKDISRAEVAIIVKRLLIQSNLIDAD